MNFSAFFLPALALIALGLLSTTNQVLVIAILVVAVSLNAGQYFGFMVNHIDLSPNHAGTLMAITNTLATIFSIIAPLAVDEVGSFSGYKEVSGIMLTNSSLNCRSNHNTRIKHLLLLKEIL